MNFENLLESNVIAATCTAISVRNVVVLATLGSAQTTQKRQRSESEKLDLKDRQL